MYRKILKDNWGYDDFRPLQLDIIESIGAGIDTLAILPTGGGKSITYQVPALAMDGMALIVSPLIALMTDQIQNLKKRGIRAEVIHAGMSRDRVFNILEQAQYGAFKMLYVAPERLQSELFLKRLQFLQLSLIAVDEAHCISEWGYDFRPSYLKIADLREMYPDVPILALTASATPDVVSDIKDKLLFRTPSNMFQASVERNNLHYVVRMSDNKDAQLYKILIAVQGSAIVYTRTRDGAEKVAKMLQSMDLSANYYHAGLEANERRERQNSWMSGETRVLCATNAFGMGIDKPDVAYVLHYSIPLNLEHYYQEAGRAGRNGEPAECMLYFAEADVARCKWLLENSAGQSELSPELEKKHLEQNQERLALMVLYCKTYGCLRNYILRYFGEEPKDDCGKCSRCTDPILPKTEKKQGSDALYKKLAAKRNEIAKRKRLPAYVVFTNETLQALAEERPKTYYDFIRIYGIGKRKAELYASDFLAIINGYTTKKAANSGKVWSADEIRRLKLAYFRGKSIADIAKIHERSEGAIRERLEKLGLI